MGALNENTKIPIGWGFALLAGCATFTTLAFSAGSYFGAGDAQAKSLEQRVVVLEKAIEKIPSMSEGIARLEGALGTLPKDRKPAKEE